MGLVYLFSIPYCHTFLLLTSVEMCGNIEKRYTRFIQLCLSDCWLIRNVHTLRWHLKYHRSQYYSFWILTRHVTGWMWIL